MKVNKASLNLKKAPQKLCAVSLKLSQTFFEKSLMFFEQGLMFFKKGLGLHLQYVFGECWAFVLVLLSFVLRGCLTSARYYVGLCFCDDFGMI
jgi:hypothetical protein